MFFSIQGPSILVASSWVWSLREVVHPNLRLETWRIPKYFKVPNGYEGKACLIWKKHTFFSVLITGFRFSGFLFLLNLIMLIILRRSYLDWYKLIEPLNLGCNQRYLVVFFPALQNPPPCGFLDWGHKKRATIEFQNNKAVPVEWVRHLRNGSTTDQGSGWWHGGWWHQGQCEWWMASSPLGFRLVVGLYCSWAYFC